MRPGEEFDQFADIRNSETGIFGDGQAGLGQGLRQFDSASTTARMDGVIVSLHCVPQKDSNMPGCGRPIQIVLEYPELVALKFGVLPQQLFGHPQLPPPLRALIAHPAEWGYSPHNGAFFPRVRCGGCRTEARPLISMAEAASHLERARAQAWINGEAERALSQFAAQLAQAQLAAQAQQAQRMR